MPENEEGITSLSEFKRRKIEQALQDDFGFVLSGPDCIFFGVSSNSSILWQEDIDSKKLMVLGVAGSLTDQRDFQNSLLSFIGFFSERFSERDLSFFVLLDYATSFIQSYYYGKSSEKPLPVELIIVELEPTSANVATIQFDGESSFFNIRNGGLKIVGCTDPKKRRALIQALLETAKKPGEEMDKELENLMATSPNRNSFIYKVNFKSAPPKDTPQK